MKDQDMVRNPISEKTSQDVKSLTKRCNEHLQHEFTRALKGIVESYEDFRGKVLKNLETSVPSRFPSHEKAGIIAQIKADFPCHISQLYHDQTGSFAFVDFQFSLGKETTFTMPSELQTFDLTAETVCTALAFSLC